LNYKTECLINKVDKIHYFHFQVIQLYDYKLKIKKITIIVSIFIFIFIFFAGFHLFINKIVYFF
jgi:hypothetical protein